MLLTSLAAAFDLAAGLLAEGVRDAASPWRTITLATRGLAGGVRQRSVVLRDFAAGEPPVLELHTDRRSVKTAELAACAQAGMHGWDAARRVQLRISGRVTVHAGDAVAARAWAGLTPASRDTYRVELAPGAVIAAPDAARRTLDDAAAFRVFAVLVLTPGELEILELAPEGHRRARLRWRGAGREQAWLVP